MVSLEFKCAEGKDIISLVLLNSMGLDGRVDGSSLKKEMGNSRVSTQPFVGRR